MVTILKNKNENKIDEYALYGWRHIKDPLKEELEFITLKYEKYMDIYKEC